MIASNSDTTQADLFDLRIQIELIKANNQNNLEKIAQLEQKLKEKQTAIEIKDDELKQALTQITDQKVLLNNTQHLDEQKNQLEQKLREEKNNSVKLNLELKQLSTKINDQKVLLNLAKYQEERTVQLEQTLKDEQKTSVRLDVELEQAKKKINEQKTQLAVYNEKFRKIERNNVLDRFLSILAILLFMLAAGLASLGYNLVTSSSPNSLGIGLIVMAVIIHITATFIVTFGKGNSNP